MKAIHNYALYFPHLIFVVLYLKDTEKWKQFTTSYPAFSNNLQLCCISKIQKNESNSQRNLLALQTYKCCVVSQRYRKMKAIHNNTVICLAWGIVVLYLKDTEKWKQFTTTLLSTNTWTLLCCISKIQKNESNSQLRFFSFKLRISCVVSQRYRKMKAIHNCFI